MNEMFHMEVRYIVILTKREIYLVTLEPNLFIMSVLYVVELLSRLTLNLVCI